MSLNSSQVANIVSQLQKLFRTFETETTAVLQGEKSRDAVMALLDELPIMLVDRIIEIGLEVPPALAPRNVRPQIVTTPPPVPPREQAPPAPSRAPREQAPREQAPPARPQRQPDPVGPRVSLEESENLRVSSFKEWPAQDPEYPYMKLIVDHNGYILDNETHKVWCRMSHSRGVIKGLSTLHVEHCLELGYPVLFEDEMPEKLSSYLRKFGGKRRQFTPRYEQEEKECSICQTEMTYPDHIYCGHKFHRDCLGKWRDQCLTDDRDPHCPVCKTPM